MRTFYFIYEKSELCFYKIMKNEIIIKTVAIRKQNKTQKLY